MEESAPTMKEAANSVAIANHNILVNAVKMIGVIFINAKIMEHVLLISLTIFQHQNVNVREIMVAEFVTWTYARTLNVVTELVLAELVNAIKIMSTLTISVNKHVS